MAYTFLDFTEEVLQESHIPLSAREIWEKGEHKGLHNKFSKKIKGKTPWSTISSHVGTDIRGNPNSKFISIGKSPTKFFLKARQHEHSTELLDSVNNTNSTKKESNSSKKQSYAERDLHPLLTYFVHHNTDFNRGRKIHTKTIYHEISNKKGYSSWAYPDIVGFYLPVEEWEDPILEFDKFFGLNVLLMSFELKIKIDKGNYRESFFQALSNSSWAHQGYLVTSEIANDKELRGELFRLSDFFGIGILQLNIQEIKNSQILFPAKSKDNLDWETMNKLCKENKEFQDFIKSVCDVRNTGKIHLNEYDEILSPEKLKQHIKKITKIPNK